MQLTAAFVMVKVPFNLKSLTINNATLKYDSDCIIDILKRHVAGT